MDKKEFEKTLISLIENNSNIEADEDDIPIITGLDDVISFEERGLCTMDNGVVLMFEDGTEVYLTIQIR